jgi:PEP-CTERM motif
VITTSTDPLMDGLAFSPGGTLFGLNQAVSQFMGPPVEPALYTIDPTTGVATLVGSTGVSGSFGLGGLAFRSDGALFATFTSFGTPDSDLYRIDPTTGAATLIGPTGFDQLDGLAFLGTTTIPTVPEPATYWLLGTALLLPLIRRRKAS